MPVRLSSGFGAPHGSRHEVRRVVSDGFCCACVNNGDFSSSFAREQNGTNDEKDT